MSKTFYEAQLELQEAVRDLGYAVVKAWGIIRLVHWLGLTPKALVLEREAREQATVEKDDER